MADRLIHKKSLVLFISFCLGIAALMGTYLYVSYHGEMNAARERVENISLLVAEWVKSYFEKSDYVLRDIVGMVNASDIAKPELNSARHTELSTRIEAKRKTVPHTMRVALFNGECVITHFPGYEYKIGADVTYLEYCKVMRDRPDLNTYVTHTYLGQVGKTLHVLQARRLVDERGRIDGFAGIAINLELTGDLLDSITLPPHGLIAVLDTNKMLVARKPAITEAVGKMIESPRLIHFIQTNQRYTTYCSESLVDHEERLTALRRVGDLPFIVVVGEARRTILNTWYQRAWGVALLTLAFWGMAFIILHHYQTLVIQRQLIEHQATHDALTGVPTLRLITDRLQRACQRAKREQKKAAVLFIDLDGFKAANDHFGHDAGDHVLKEVANRIKSLLRSVDTVGRKGGDEFVVILEHLNTADEACIVAEKLIRLINQPVIFERHLIPIGASIGIAILPDHSNAPATLLALADQAMYAVKRSGKNRFALYSEVCCSTGGEHASI